MPILKDEAPTVYQELYQHYPTKIKVPILKEFGHGRKARNPPRPPPTRPRLPNPYLLMTGRLGMDEEVVLPVT